MRIERNVRTKERAMQMVEMANTLQVQANYIASGIWYVVNFHPRSETNWYILENRMKLKFLNKKQKNENIIF